MATPSRYQDFDMSSVKKDYSQGAVSSFAAAAQGAPTPAQQTGRDSEQRFAKMVAEAEYKLLEEKARAHEREAKLKEELAREKAGIPQLVSERVDQILRERGNVGAGSVQSDTHATEVATLKQHLVETQRLLADAERRYQQEKRELLKLRTSHLKTETAKRGQEGDIIGRAMQVMSEYETIVRASEENSLARLAHHMETFESEWLRRSKEFEERKAEFETLVMSKALESLKEHNQDVESIGENILQRTVELIKQQSRSRLELEQQVLEQSEIFKQQYKELLDQEYKERCRMYDEKIALRERNLVQIVQEERDRIIHAEREAVEKSEAGHVQALAAAMSDISALREAIVKEHQEQQQAAINELILKREEMRGEQCKIIQQANERVATIEHRCIEAVDSAQKALKDCQLQMAEREADFTRQMMAVQGSKEKERVQEMAQVRGEVEAQWKQTIEGVRTEHLRELQEVKSDMQERLDKEHSEQFSREQELRRSYDVKMKKMEEQAEQRWSKRLAESNRGLERHLEVIQALRDDNEQLNHQLSSLQQQLSLRENEFSAKIAAVQREHEQVWHRKLEEMRQRYDQLLDEALGGPQGDTVTRLEHEKVLESLRELEERCVEMKKTEGSRLAAEREQLNEMWRSRLDQERAERAVWEEEQLSKLSEMRIELEAETRRKETELVRRAEQERMRMHDEGLRRTIEDRRDRETFEQRLRDEFQVKIREAEDELNEAYLQKVKVLERRVDEKEAQVEKQRASLKSEMMAFEEQSKQQAIEWMEREKEAILSDVKRFHEKLTAEQERMEEDRSQFEQQVALKYADLFERAKADLQRKMLDVTNIHIAYWQRCETEWLNFRAEETAVIYRLRSEHEHRMFEYAQNAAEKASEQAQSMLRKEQQLLDERESNLYAEIEQARLAQEAASRERALRLLDERNKIQEEAEKQRAAEETRLWEELEKKVLEKEQQAEADRRILELDLRTRYEAMISSERQRVDQLMDQHRKESHVMFEKHETNIREREEAWHRQRLAIELEEKNSHETQYHDLRMQCESRVHEERRRFESSLKLREVEFEKERQRLLDNLDGQFKDHEKTTKSQLNQIKEDYEQRIKQQMIENQAQREQHLIDISAQERQFQSARDEYEAESAKRFERAMSELRTQIERRVKEQQSRELEARESLEKSRRAYEQRINEQYEKLLTDHEDKMFKSLKERDSRIAELESEHQQHLLKLREDMDHSLTSYFQTADARAREAAESVRSQFQQRLDEFNSLLSDERRKRHEAEDHLAEIRDEMETLRAGVEQHKLETHRNLQAKFDRMFSEVKEKAKREKEEMAKRLLEEEERRLAKELLKTDGDQKKEMTSEISRSWDAQHSLTGTTRTTGHASMNAGTPGSTSIATSLFGAPSGQTGAGQLGTAFSKGNATSYGYTPGPVSRGPASQTSPSEVTEDERVTIEMAGKRREKLQQLWQVLDTPLPARNAFLDDVMVLPPMKMLETLNQEIKRLETQLPLLELITRREFLQHRQHELERAGSRAGPQGATQLGEIKAELKKLNDQLLQDIPKHEQRYGGRFHFRGVPYLDVLAKEMQEATGAGVTRTPRSVDASFRTPGH